MRSGGWGEQVLGNSNRQRCSVSGMAERELAQKQGHCVRMTSHSNCEHLRGVRDSVQASG